MKKSAAVFFATGFEEIEALTAVDLLRRAGFETVCVSIDNEKRVTGSHNITVEMDAGLDRLDFGLYDILICPGGMPGTKNLEACEWLTKNIRADNIILLMRLWMCARSSSKQVPSCPKRPPRCMWARSRILN